MPNSNARNAMMLPPGRAKLFAAARVLGLHVHVLHASTERDFSDGSRGPGEAYCLVPLTAWVAFATVLNFSIWILNR
jgi:tryptophan-rich sensory protein